MAIRHFLFRWMPLQMTSKKLPSLNSAPGCIFPTISEKVSNPTRLFHRSFIKTLRATSSSGQTTTLRTTTSRFQELQIRFTTIGDSIVEPVEWLRFDAGSQYDKASKHFSLSIIGGWDKPPTLALETVLAQPETGHSPKMLVTIRASVFGSMYGQQLVHNSGTATNRLRVSQPIKTFPQHAIHILYLWCPKNID